MIIRVKNFCRHNETFSVSYATYRIFMIHGPNLHTTDYALVVCSTDMHNSSVDNIDTDVKLEEFLTSIRARGK